MHDANATEQADEPITTPAGPSVAVITRTKNRNLLLKRALESVLAQSHQNWVHVVVNDGGEPGPVESLLAPFRERYGDRLLLIHNEESQGMERASNIGIKASSSDYVVIHDDDDSWDPRFLQCTLQAIADSPFESVKGAISQIHQIFERMDEQAGTVTEERSQDYDENFFSISLPQITQVNRFLPIAFIFERSVFDTVGYYDESLPVVGDWEFNIRYFMQFDAIVVPEKLANYHVRVSGKSDYSNSVTAKHDQHMFYRSLIVNKHLREDIRAGRTTLGDLMAQGEYSFSVAGSIWRLNAAIDKLKTIPPIPLIRRILGK